MMAAKETKEVAAKEDSKLARWIGILGAIGGLLTVMATSAVLVIGAFEKTNKSLEEVHTRTKEVLNETRQTNVAINSIHRASLQRNLTDKERIFELTGKPLDEDAVKEARKDIADHDQQQKKVDEEKQNQALEK